MGTTARLAPPVLGRPRGDAGEHHPLSAEWRLPSSVTPPVDRPDTTPDGEWCQGVGTVLVTVPTDLRTVSGAKALVAGVVTCACTCVCP